MTNYLLNPPLPVDTAFLFEIHAEFGGGGLRIATFSIFFVGQT